MESLSRALRCQLERTNLENHQIFNHLHPETVQHKNQGRATSLQTAEQECPLVHILHLPRLSNQGVGVASSPKTLNIPGAGLQLEMVYYVCSLLSLYVSVRIKVFSLPAH